MNSAIVFLFIPIVLLIGDYLNGMALITHMQKKWPTVWEDFGATNLTDSNLAPGRLKLARFVWTFSFFKLHDSRLNFHCAVAIGCQIALAICFVLALPRISAGV